MKQKWCNELLVEDSDYRCGFVVKNEWKFVTDHYFTDRKEAEKFISELQKSIEKVWPVDGY